MLPCGSHEKSMMVRCSHRTSKDESPSCGETCKRPLGCGNAEHVCLVRLNLDICFQVSLTHRPSLCLRNLATPGHVLPVPFSRPKLAIVLAQPNPLLVAPLSPLPCHARLLPPPGSDPTLAHPPVSEHTTVESTSVHFIAIPTLYPTLKRRTLARLAQSLYGVARVGQRA